MSLVKKGLKDTLIYGFGTVLTRFSSLIALPILTSAFSPEQFAIIGFVLMALPFTRYVFPLEISQAASIYLVDANNDKERRSYFSTGFNFTLFIVFGLLVLAVIINYIFPKLHFIFLSFSISTPLWSLLVLAIALIFDSLSYYCMSAIRWLGHSKYYTFNSFVVAWVNVSLIYFLVKFLSLGLMGVFVSWFASWAIGFFIACIPVRKYFSWRLSGVVLKKMLRFSFPLFLNNIPLNFNLMVDRYIILVFIGMYSVGLYSAAFSTASIVSIAATIMQLAVWPIVYKAHKLDNAETQVKELLNTAMILIIALAASTILLSSVVANILLGENFSNSSTVQFIIPFLMLNYFIATLTNFFPGIAISKKNYYVIFSTIAALLINVFGGIASAYFFGIKGICLSLVTATVCQVFLYGYFSQRFFKLPFVKSDFVFFLPMATLFIGLSIYLNAILSSRTELGLILRFLFVLIVLGNAAFFVLKSKHINVLALTKKTSC